MRPLRVHAYDLPGSDEGTRDDGGSSADVSRNGSAARVSSRRSCRPSRSPLHVRVGRKPVQAARRDVVGRGSLATRPRSRSYRARPPPPAATALPTRGAAGLLRPRREGAGGRREARRRGDPPTPDRRGALPREYEPESRTATRGSSRARELVARDAEEPRHVLRGLGTSPRRRQATRYVSATTSSASPRPTLRSA